MAGSDQKSQITKDEALAFRRRWQLVNLAEREELRTTPAEVKWRQFVTLMAFAREMGWDRLTESEDTSGRANWRKLRLAYGV